MVQDSLIIRIDFEVGGGVRVMLLNAVGVGDGVLGQYTPLGLGCRVLSALRFMP
jgi:hypothetical protein